jgi:hypothetical protein
VKSRRTRALALGGALTVIASAASVALTAAPAVAGINPNTSYEFDCTTPLQAGTNPFEVVANLSAAPDPSFYNGASFGAGGALTFPISGGVVAGFAGNGITHTGLNIAGLTIGSTDGSANGTYTYSQSFGQQNVVAAATVTGASWDNTVSTTTINAAANTFTPSEIGDGVGGSAALALPLGATITAVNGTGTQATIQSAAGGLTNIQTNATINLYAPMVFTDAAVSTGAAFTTNTTFGGDANIGVQPGTVTSWTFTTSLGVNVEFGGNTGVGPVQGGNCVQTGWTATNAPGPGQAGAATPALPPAALGGATSLVAVGASGHFTQPGDGGNHITPPAAAFVVGNDPAPNAGNANVSLGIGGTKQISLPNSAGGGNPASSCAISTPPSDPRLAVTGVNSSPGSCTATITDSGVGPATVTFSFTASNADSTSTPGTITVSIGTPAVDEPISQLVNPGQLVLSCADPALPVSLHCNTLNLPAITLNGVAQTTSGAGSTLYVSDNRGDPSTGWNLQASVVASSAADNANPSCAGLADFCNSTQGTNALNPNGQIPANDLSIGSIACTPHAGNSNTTAGITNGAGGPFGGNVAICGAAAGVSGGSWNVNKVYTLTIPASVYSGTYVGTVEYVVS